MSRNSSRRRTISRGTLDDLRKLARAEQQQERQPPSQQQQAKKPPRPKSKK